MIKSITGFGRYELSESGKKIAVEIKSVNHRYLDINIRMPKKFNCMEADIRNILKRYIIRGKVDVSISYEDLHNSALALKYNRELAEAYLMYFKEMEKDFGLKSDTSISSYALARFPEVLTMEETAQDDEALWGLLGTAVEEAAKKFDETKVTEGAALRDDLIGKLDFMLENIDAAEERYPDIIKEYEEKLRAKLGELLESTQIDENRIAAELVIFSDKLCTDEEIVRLRNHVTTMKQVLCDGGEAGRRLDFMAQEMNREANTLLSKANDFRTSQIGIDLKTTIEKIREQIQNIE